jgi:hypothetical protein
MEIGIVEQPLSISVSISILKIDVVEQALKTMLSCIHLAAKYSIVCYQFGISAVQVQVHISTVIRFIYFIVLTVSIVYGMQAKCRRRQIQYKAVDK